ncbi:MAG TPA: secondary thiamine-phosphate synthase enzyme YjbQ [Acidisphaera sp.]|nr:secondary thiamine-phosphate synthase enzyme YjbQ [Acidisphaera sp.]
MRQSQTVLDVPTSHAGLHDITGEVARWVAGQGIGQGLLTVFIRHTSASLVIQENADPTVLADLEAHFRRLVPEQPGLYRHDTEGPDDMPAHIRTALTQVSLGIPVRDGRPVLGTWQGIYVWEHRATPHRRQVVLHLLGE